MKRLCFGLAIALVCLATLSCIGAESGPPPVLLIFDSSGSMNEKPQGVPKIQQAKDVVRDLLHEFPADVPLGLMVYGHRRAHDCTDIEVVEGISLSEPGRLTRMSTMLMGLTAKGETPIAQALVDAIPLFGGKPGRIVLITDGREECGGDVCAAARKLAQSGISLKVDIVGFALTDEQRASLACITEATDGHYYDARDAASLRSAVNAAATRVLGRGRLEVLVTEGGKTTAVAPMVRVRDDKGMDVSLVENPAVFRLPPGTYRVSAHVGAGPESAAVEATLPEGADKSVGIDLGTGTLNIRVTKGEGRQFKQRPMIELRRPDEANPVAGMADHTARFQAQAGSYTVRVGLAGVQKKDFPGVAIKAGETASAELEVPGGDVEVTVSGGRYAPGANPLPYVQVLQDGAMLTALTANPARFQLLAGRYTLGLSGDGKTVTTKVIDVRQGDDLAVELRAGE